MTITQRFLGFSRLSKQLFAFVFDVSAATLAFVLATSLHDSGLSFSDKFALGVTIALVGASSLAALGFYHAVIHTFGFLSLRPLFMVIPLMFATAWFALLKKHEAYALSDALLVACLSLILIGGARLCIRALLAYLSHGHGHRRRVIIYGAGAAGLEAAVSLRLGHEYQPVAFVDDDASLHNTFIHGLRVYSPNQLRQMATRCKADMVLLAAPDLSMRKRKELLSQLSPYPIEVKTVPTINDILSGKTQLKAARDVSAESLLDRKPVKPIAKLLRKNVTGKGILVTGAGGSIGAELARQIAALRPRLLVLLDMSEYALYRVEKALQNAIDNKTLVVPVLGSVTDRPLLNELFQRFVIDTVYHAAAYKHVPMVEQNVMSGIRNNVFGTLEMAQAAGEAQIESFILISTDKAVRPTSVMGATKRLAEIVLQALDVEYANTTYSMVRFGNVLESSGSVVPLFKDQIAAGGPLTVTHPDAARYFMTIPEATSLVIQAGAMAKGGDVFLLDMGEPMRIVDLARKMVHLSGLTVRDQDNADGDIDIVITGLRAGEKLREELLITTKHAKRTEHPRILRAEEQSFPWLQVQRVLGDLARAVEEGNLKKARSILMDPGWRFTQLHSA